MQLCYLLIQTAIDDSLKNILKNLQDEEIISCYTCIDELRLGFPFSEPKNDAVYRVDNLLKDLDNKRLFWGKASPSELNEVRNFYYNAAAEFFKTSDITKWTNELNALIDKDKTLKNELTDKASSLIKDTDGYVMVRAIVANGKLPELEQKLDGRYLRRTIEV